MSIRVDNLSQKYGDRYILKDINVEIFPGEILGIIGPNGSGKSTLVKMIAGDFSSTYGLIKYEGISLNKYSLLDRAKYRSVVSQEQNIMFDFTVKEVIEMGIIGGYGLNFNSEVWKKFEIVIKTLGIDKYANRSIRTLSGGELQRVHLARALIQIWHKNGYPTPKYIFLDEPTSNLDIGQELRFLNFIKNEVKRGLGAAIIFHDLNLAAHFSDKILLLSRGYVLDFGPPEEILTPSLIHKAYRLKVKVQKKPFRLSYLHLVIIMNQLIEKSEMTLSLGGKAFKAKSIKHLVVIFIIFAISGSVAVFCSKFLLLLLNLDRESLGNYIYWPIRLLVLLVAYQFILLFVSTIFGEFNHFKKYSLKFISIIRKSDPFKVLKKYYNEDRNY